jgi:signal transduction histidine kinase
LVAAIEGSVMRALETQPEIEVVLEVADQTGIRRAERPPQGVELAAFRIVHEAVANAIAHSGARLIHLSGELKQESIVLSIRDDGRGMMPGADRRALDAGHLGLVSMRRRAEAIGARLDIRSSGDGTEVRLEWQA